MVREPCRSTNVLLVRYVYGVLWTRWKTYKTFTPMLVLKEITLSAIRKGWIRKGCILTALFLPLSLRHLSLLSLHLAFNYSFFNTFLQLLLVHCHSTSLAEALFAIVVSVVVVVIIVELTERV